MKTLCILVFKENNVANLFLKYVIQKRFNEKIVSTDSLIVLKYRKLHYYTIIIIIISIFIIIRAIIKFKIHQTKIEFKKFSFFSFLSVKISIYRQNRIPFLWDKKENNSSSFRYKKCYLFPLNRICSDNVCNREKKMVKKKDEIF